MITTTPTFAYSLIQVPYKCGTAMDVSLLQACYNPFNVIYCLLLAACLVTVYMLQAKTGKKKAADVYFEIQSPGDGISHNQGAVYKTGLI